ADLRVEVRLSDVISLVMDIPGVRAVRQMLIGPEPAPDAAAPIQNRWVVPVEPGRQATLKADRSRLVYYKGDMPIVPMASGALPAGGATAITCEDIPVPAGRPRNVKGFTSFQRDFPAIYGLGEHEPSGSAPSRRRALAGQLKAYLL